MHRASVASVDGASWLIPCLQSKEVRVSFSTFEPHALSPDVSTNPADLHLLPPQGSLRVFQQLQVVMAHASFKRNLSDAQQTARWMTGDNPPSLPSTSLHQLPPPVAACLPLPPVPSHPSPSSPCARIVYMSELYSSHKLGVVVG